MDDLFAQFALEYPKTIQPTLVEQRTAVERGNQGRTQFSGNLEKQFSQAGAKNSSSVATLEQRVQQLEERLAEEKHHNCHDDLNASSAGSSKKKEKLINNLKIQNNKKKLTEHCVCPVMVEVVVWRKFEKR